MKKITGTLSTSGSVAASLGRGYKGDAAYIHIAYANSSDGVTDFTLTPAPAKTYEYIGQYSDHTDTASTNPDSYVWSWLTDEERRQVAEETRAVAETKRVNAETARADAETERVAAEDARKSAESDREVAETARDKAEQERAAAESNRVATENTRQAALTAAVNSATTSASNASTSAENAASSATTAKEAETAVEGFIDSIAQEPTAQQILAVMQQELTALNKLVEEGTGGKGNLNGFSFSRGEDGEVIISYVNPDDESDTATSTFATKNTANLIAQEIASINESLHTIAGTEG